jgi:hypothetical protein
MADITPPGYRNGNGNGALLQKILLPLFGVIVSALLGAILTYASSIAATQKDQYNLINKQQGELETMAQANSDRIGQVGDLTTAVSNMQVILNAQGNRISTLEAVRHN